MVRKLLDWAIHNPFIVLLGGLTLLVVGGYAFFNVNVEAYPDPAPPIIEVVAQYPGASAEEVERLVTVPLEVALAGMPGLQVTRSRSCFGLGHLRNQFDYSRDYEQAKQDVINRLTTANLPPGVTPQISPASPIGEIYRFTLSSPRDSKGRAIYSLNDLKALLDYVVAREISRVPRIAGVVCSGGTVKRYEVQPDPDALYKYGITLAQLQKAIGDANGNGSGDNLAQGQSNLVVRGLGLYGAGKDPMIRTFGWSDPSAAAAFLRAEEAKRIREIRQTVVTTVNNVPVRVDHLVDGGPLLDAEGKAKVDDDVLVQQGVIISHQTRQGKIGISRPKKNAAGEWEDSDEEVQGVVLMRKGQESIPALRDVAAKINELNEAGHLLPGVQIVPYYNRNELIDVTTETVHENLLVGMGLVSMILLMFLGNVRVALIVAINVPLALLFAFGVLFLRGRSANLLSIGAVDFGIIVDSTVILVESIYRHVTSGDQKEGTFTQRVMKACVEVERSLFFSTIIMVCALLPLFTMKGPEGQIFGPMADTYAFALGGALLLALTVSPVLCCLLLKNIKPARENFLVRGLQKAYLWQLNVLMRFRWLALFSFVLVIVGTGLVAANMGREFMPELEEGNLYIRATLPIDVSFEEVGERTKTVRGILQKYPEAATIVSQIGRPDDGTDPTGYYNVEIFVPLKAQKDWPIPAGRDRPRTKDELVREMNAELDELFPGADFDFSQMIRDNVMEALSGVKGENSIKLFGPDLEELERLAEKAKGVLQDTPGVVNVGICRIQGQSNLEFPVDRLKCSRWNVSVADVQNVIQAAVGGKALTQMTEGGKTFDITLRFPERLRKDEHAIKEILVEVINNQVKAATGFTLAPTPIGGGAASLSPTGTSVPLPSPTGTTLHAPLLLSAVPRRPLKDLVTPLDSRGEPNLDPHAGFIKPGASMIYREQGQRFIAVKFGVRGRDLAGTVAEAQRGVAPLLKLPYRAEWSGEFQEMEEAEARLAKVFAISLALIILLLYMAFRSALDAAVVLVNVLVMVVGGVWALKITGMNFNISAAVGFISILGVAVMNGLLFVSAFNRLRAKGIPVQQALVDGTRQMVRPIAMTALAAILGLLPAALSTRIGAQSQRPLAIAVVGGMLATLLVMNVVPLLYSLYGRRQPPEGAGDMGH
ncbi:MAG: efflux RND transporter permease subunit [Gemmataceae bacterium]